jgi:DNA invertase Pin-like site-specific DNA recombinase
VQGLIELEYSDLAATRIGKSGSGLRAGPQGLWSGRWESNPAPYAANLLDSQRGFLFIGTTWDQKRGQLFNCFTVRSLDEMSINAQDNSRVRMTELALRHFWRSATFDAHKRRFDVVCVWRFDRFARSVSHLLRALETFKALGIDFVSFSEQMDTSTPAGKMVFTVLGAVAELERSLIVERVRAGMRNARAKGRRIGRPPQTQLSPEMRQVIAKTYVRGETSLRALAKRFGTSLATVQRCIGLDQRAAGEGPA